MRIITDDGKCQQRCRACHILLEIDKSDVTIESGWFHYRCMNCNRLNEAVNVPESYYELLR